MNVGVLSFQGDVIEHINHIRKLGYTPIEVKNSDDIEELDALILPGGESTTIGKLLRITKMDKVIKKKIENGLPVWGTCAGMILLAKNIEDEEENYLGTMDITVKRNAYGSQIDSFERTKIIDEISNKPLKMIFIRGPYVKKYGLDVKPLVYVDGNIVGVEEKNMLATSFHPELTESTMFLEYFLKKFCKGK